MAATSYLVIEIADEKASVTQMNQLVIDSSKPHEGIQNLITYLYGLKGGNQSATVTIAVRSTTSSPSASGGGSSVTHTKK